MGTRRTLTKDIGATGLDIRWGHVDSDFLTSWRGKKKVETVEEMLSNSGVIGALRMAIEMPVRDVEWYFTSDEGDDDPRLELLNDALENMSYGWADHVVDALLMLYYGWAVFTDKYERVGGRLLWKKFKMLGHDSIMRWDIEADGGINGLWQYPHYWPDLIPMERMLLYRFRKTRNNPEGESILRPAYIHWHFVKNIQDIHGIGIERNLAGLPVIMPPMGAQMDGTDKDQAELIVRNVRNDEQAGIVLPPPTGEGDHQRWRLELMSASQGDKSGDAIEAISHHEKRMLMSALSQFLMLGMDNVGAMATFGGATDFFTLAVNTVASIIGDTFTKHMIPRLMRYNGLDDTGLKLEHSPAGDIGLDTIGTFLQQAGMFLTWTPDDEAWLRGLARLPEKTPEELDVLMQEEQARKDERARAMQQAMQQRGEVDENIAQYASTPRQIEREKQTLESRWAASMRRYLREQKGRLLEVVEGD